MLAFFCIKFISNKWFIHKPLPPPLLIVISWTHIVRIKPRKRQIPFIFKSCPSNGPGVTAGHPDAYGKSEDLTDDGQGRNLLVGCLIVKGGLTPKKDGIFASCFSSRKSFKDPAGAIPKGGMWFQKVAWIWIVKIFQAIFVLDLFFMFSKIIHPEIFNVPFWI